MSKQTDEVGILGDIASLNKAGYAVEFRPMPDALLRCTIRHYGEVDIKEAQGTAVTYAESFLNALSAHEEFLAEASGRRGKKK